MTPRDKLRVDLIRRLYLLYRRAVPNEAFSEEEDKQYQEHKAAGDTPSEKALLHKLAMRMAIREADSVVELAYPQKGSEQ